MLMALIKMKKKREKIVNMKIMMMKNMITKIIITMTGKDIIII
jgi:hypothetical protein